ncbi:hypothetical protein D3C71_2083410 [compost metagenome]
MRERHVEHRGSICHIQGVQVALVDLLTPDDARSDDGNRQHVADITVLDQIPDEVDGRNGTRLKADRRKRIPALGQR